MNIIYYCGFVGWRYIFSKKFFSNLTFIKLLCGKETILTIVQYYEV